MSLVSQGRGVSRGALGGLGVLGSRCLGSPGSPLRVLGPFSFATPSLSCSDPPSQLQPPFHQGAGFVRCCVRLGGEGGHRDRTSFPWVLQSPLCHSQSHRGLAISHASTVGWSSPVSTWRLLSPFSNLSVRGIGWCPWISRMPTSRFRFIQLLAVTSGFAWGMRCISFGPCASASLRPLRCSPASWLLSRQLCIVTDFVFFVT